MRGAILIGAGLRAETPDATVSEIVILQQPASAGGKAFWPVPVRPLGTPGLPLRVVAGARPVDEHDWLVADDPGVVAGGQGRDLARADLELRAVRHHDVDAAGGWYWKWGASHHSVPAMGLTCCDQRQPGSSVSLPTTPPPMLTISALPFSNVRVSSGT